VLDNGASPCLSTPYCRLPLSLATPVEHCVAAPSPSPLDPQEAIRRRAEACQAVVDNAVNQRLEVQEFLDGLKLAGATSAEAEDYGRQYVQRMEGARAFDINHHPARDTTPEDLDDEQREAFRQDREVRTRDAAAQGDEMLWRKWHGRYSNRNFAGFNQPNSLSTPPVTSSRNSLLFSEKENRPLPRCSLPRSYKPRLTSKPFRHPPSTIPISVLPGDSDAFTRLMSMESLMG